MIRFDNNPGVFQFRVVDVLSMLVSSMVRHTSEFRSECALRNARSVMH